MAYFKIGDKDYSMYVNELKIETDVKYNSQENAAGNTVVDYINKKRVIKVGIIPLDDTAMADLQADIEQFNVSISFRNPKTKALEENVNCIIPSSDVDYYTIQADKVLFNGMTLNFKEL